ncbi:hypothetical protein ACWD7F_25515 [Streptomyces sp. NPDC005122]
MNPPEQRATHPTARAAEPPPERTPAVTLRTAHRPASAALFLPSTSQDRFRWTTNLAAIAAAGPNVRIRARPWLTDAQWSGNVDQAARVIDKLVDNALRHGTAIPDNDTPEGVIPARMIVRQETEELVIEVDDALPEFPHFEEVIKQVDESKGKPTGLWWVVHYRGNLTWKVKRNAGDAVVGKTVTATLPANWDAT